MMYCVCFKASEYDLAYPNGPNFSTNPNFTNNYTRNLDCTDKLMS